MKEERNLHICVWINSYIGQKSPLFQEAMEKGYLLKRPNGDVWQWDLWQAGMGLVDFTTPPPGSGTRTSSACCWTRAWTALRPTSASASPPTWCTTTAPTPS